MGETDDETSDHLYFGYSHLIARDHLWAVRKWMCNEPTQTYIGVEIYACNFENHDTTIGTL